MRSLDEEMLDAICGLQGRGAWLFTVVSTLGSAPRPPGSLLLIDAQGRRTGSVSGGCQEDDLAERVRSGTLEGPGPTLVALVDGSGESARPELPCGGRIELIAEPVEATVQWQSLGRLVRNRATVDRRLCLRTGETSLHPHPATTGLRYEPAASLTRTFGPAWQLVVVGAVPIARYLAPIASSLGFRVLVCDPRPEARRDWDIAEAELDPRMPDEVASTGADDPRSALVTLTHDPRIDDMALMEALQGRAFYVGALGSSRAQAARRERLAALGVAEPQIRRLHGPVGLDLRARTAPEIAVAIAAELILARQGADSPLLAGTHGPKDPRCPTDAA